MYIWTQNNTVTDNTVKGNIVGILIAASQNSFTGNFIENNTDGMFVGVSSPYNPYSDIAIHNNYFINNTQQINGCHCLGTLNETNPWGINVDGNYWSDYNGTEKNSNGTGVIPYLVNGKIPDNHPLMSLPSAQLSETSKNSDIELLLAVILAVIFIVTLITLRKSKQKTSKGIKQTRSN
jgi:parallel beta-helix repeat protein